MMTIEQLRQSCIAAVRALQTENDQLRHDLRNLRADLEAACDRLDALEPRVDGLEADL